MPAYSFKERFVPMIKDGSKSQTIRSFRKHDPKLGQYVFLYYGMRTKHCLKIGDGIINKVHVIVIYENGDCCMIEEISATPRYKWLTPEEKDWLAWRDGFRVEGSSLPYGSFEIMYRWWNQTHALPFIGHIIYWY